MSTKVFIDEPCFFCLKPIEGEGIEWQEQNNWRDNPEGEGLTIMNLHPKCSVQLGMRLIRDGMKLVKNKKEKEFLKRSLDLCL